MISQASDPYVLFCQGRLDDVYSLYSKLRTEDSVHWSAMANSWILTRYDDVVSVLQPNEKISSSRLNLLIQQLPESVQKEVHSLHTHLATWMLDLNPPDHTRLRGLVSKSFTPRMLENLRPRIQKIVNELIDAIQKKGDMEAIHDFAFPLPATVISELLGVPVEDRDQFTRWSDDIGDFLEGVSPDFPDKARQADKKVLKLVHYFNGLFKERRQNPREDLISLLVTVEEAGDRLNEVELHGLCTFMLHAGHRTTTGLIGNGILALLRNPDQLLKLQKDPSLIPTAIEEFLRYDSAVQRISRVAKEDLEMNGKTIGRGQRIWAMLGAANRDPAQFPDPDCLDVTRAKNKHVAFAHGAHHCLGAPLARLEAQIAFSALLHRLPNMRLKGEPLKRQEGVSLRTLTSLPVAIS